MPAQQRPARELVMSTLFATLVDSVQTVFAADTQSGSAQLANPTATAGLFLGLPVFGAGIPRGAVIASLSPLTLSLPASANALQVPMKTGFVTTSRRLKHWDQVAAQPALFLRGITEEAQYPQGQGALQLLSIGAEIWIYTNAGQNPDAVPETALNNLIDAIQAAVAPDDPTQQRFTLGGLVFWCRIAGRIEKEPGDAAGQAVAMIPVEILVP